MCLCGLRLGSSIAALVGADQQGVDGLMLWDPVVQGGNYLKDLRAQHRNWLHGSFANPPWFFRPALREELLGFPLSKSLALSLQQLDLLQLQMRPAKRVLLVDTQKQDAVSALGRRLQDLGLETQQQYISAPPIWVKQDDMQGTTMVPAAVVSALVQWAECCFS